MQDWLILTAAQILEMGEWRSKAVLTYINEDAVDAQSFVNITCEESDKEA